MGIPFYGVTIGTKGPSLHPQAIKDMVDLSSGHPERIALRWQVPMFLVVKSPGQYNWKLYDEAVSMCDGAGIPLYLTIKKFPAGGNPTPLETVPFAMDIAARYGKKLAALEIGNEDFSYSEFGELADVMNAVYPKLKAINPDLLILPGATLQRNTRDMKAAVAVLLRKAGKAISGLTVHTYFGIPGTGPSTPEDESKPNVPSFRQYVLAVREVCVAEGYKDKPILDCEYGFASTKQNHSNVPIFNEADQWRHMKHCLDQARMLGVGHMSWYTLAYGDPPDGMSLKLGTHETIAYKGLKDYIQEYPTGGITLPDPDPGGDPDPDPTGPTAEELAQVRSLIAELEAQLSGLEQAKVVLSEIKSLLS